MSEVITQLTRPPGLASLEVSEVALQRLLEGMQMLSCCDRRSGDSCVAAMKVAIVAAPYGAHGQACQKLLANLLKRFEAHLATLPNQDPRNAPPAA
jgi:hypothetical protein